MEGTCLLISDLDGTLLGDNEALKRFADWLDAHRDRVRLAYSSGRFCEAVRSLVGSTPLPAPSAVIGGVGTEIRLLPSGESIDGWPRCLGSWDRPRIQGLLSQFRELDVLPAGVNKGSAAAFLATGCGLSAGQVIVAGDTGNDASQHPRATGAFQVMDGRPAQASDPTDSGARFKS